MTGQTNTYEQRIADLIRRLGSEYEGEIVATARALKRLLESRGVSFTDLGDGIEKLASGGLTQAAMEQIRDASYAKGIADTERKYAEAEGVYGLRPDGTTDWEAVALACQRRKDRIETKHHQFVDDMASRMTWGREPASDKQGKYLLSIFRQIGGRVRDGRDRRSHGKTVYWDHQRPRDRARQERRAVGVFCSCAVSVPTMRR